MIDLKHIFILFISGITFTVYSQSSLEQLNQEADALYQEFTDTLSVKEVRKITARKYISVGYHHASDVLQKRFKYRIKYYKSGLKKERLTVRTIDKNGGKKRRYKIICLDEKVVFFRKEQAFALKANVRSKRIIEKVQNRIHYYKKIEGLGLQQKSVQ